MAIDANDAAHISAAPVIEPPALIRSASPSQLSGYVNLGTQYVYRGVALRDSGIVPTAEITFNHRSGWFIAGWIGQIDIYNYYRYATEREWQSDISTGYASDLTANWQWSFARAWINNFDNSLPESKNYQEWRFNLFYRENFSTQFAYTNDYRQLGFMQWNLEAKWSEGLADFVVGELGLGHSHSASSEYANYNYGWIGAQTHWLATTWKLNWYYSSAGARDVLGSDRAGSRVELTASWPLF